MQVNLLYRVTFFSNSQQKCRSSKFLRGSGMPKGSPDRYRVSLDLKESALDRFIVHSFPNISFVTRSTATAARKNRHVF